MGATSLEAPNAEAQQVRLAVARELVERRPYESDRTLWGDVVARGYGVSELVDALTAGTQGRVLDAVAAVWQQTGRWGAPPGFAP